MRVLTFLHSYEPGGVERIALRLVRHWRSLGIDAPVFLGRADGAMATDVGQGLVVEIAAKPGISTARWETLWMILTLRGAIRRARPDVLFCAGNTYGVVALAMKLALGRRCPPIVAKISNDLDRADQHWLGRACYRLWLRLLGRVFDHVIGMEQPARAEIRERLHVADDRITIVPDPALTLRMIESARGPRPVRAADAGRRFVVVGRLAPQKNLALMLRAFRRGAGPADHLTIIGDGPERARLQTLAGRLGIGGQVTFHGYAASPIELLGDFDILLMSSNYEGVPAVILEALAANLTVIATDCSRCMSALLQDGALGTLVPVGDERALASAIETARPGTACPGLTRAQAVRFTIEHAAQSYLQVFARACARDPLSTSAAILVSRSFHGQF